MTKEEKRAVAAAGARKSPKKHAVVYTAQRTGLSAETVRVETDISRGLHAFSIIGLPDKAVEEARGRVASAIKNSGYKSPKQQNQKITISLAPGELKKTGALFDVPIALSYLLANKDIAFDANGRMFVGELALDGTIQRAQGILPLLQHAKKENIREVYIPAANAAEAGLVEGIPIFTVASFSELIAHLQNDELLEKSMPTAAKTTNEAQKHTISFLSIKGQDSVKRALTIAAAGGHNIALFGPPGTGKTLLARALTGVLPTLTKEECVEVTSIHSIAGANVTEPITTPPFRSPHHSASYASIVGGGTPCRPGEISLAHRGVLFLDEFPEFDRRVIESLREPLEEKSITLTRVTGSVRFPASCMLVIAFNPCPCGNLGSAKVCTCTPSAIASYRRKLTGPIIDRIDMWATVEASEFKDLERKRDEEDENKMDLLRRQISDARTMQAQRYDGIPITLNSETNANTIETHIPLGKEARISLRKVAERLNLSPRGYHRTLRCARSIADIEKSDAVRNEHIFEAASYRNPPEI